MEAFLLESYVLRHVADSRVQIGGGSPGAFISALCMQNASFTKSEESPVFDGTQGSVNYTTAARQMRRLFGSRGGAARQGILVAAATDVSSETKKSKEFVRREDGHAKKGENKGNGNGQSLNGFNRRAGVRNRRFMCSSGHPHSTRRADVRNRRAGVRTRRFMYVSGHPHSTRRAGVRNRRFMCSSGHPLSTRRAGVRNQRFMCSSGHPVCAG